MPLDELRREMMKMYHTTCTEYRSNATYPVLHGKAYEPGMSKKPKIRCAEHDDENVDYSCLDLRLSKLLVPRFF